MSITDSFAIIKFRDIKVPHILVLVPVKNEVKFKLIYSGRSFKLGNFDIFDSMEVIGLVIEHLEKDLATLNQYVESIAFTEQLVKSTVPALPLNPDLECLFSQYLFNKEKPDEAVLCTLWKKSEEAYFTVDIDKLVLPDMAAVMKVHNAFAACAHKGKAFLKFAPAEDNLALLGSIFLQTDREGVTTIFRLLRDMNNFTDAEYISFDRLAVLNDSFGEGSHARYIGLPSIVCPYNPINACLRSPWLEGYYEKENPNPEYPPRTSSTKPTH